MYPDIKRLSGTENWAISQYKAQRIAGDLLGRDWSVSTCMHAMTGVYVGILHNPNEKSASYNGLKTCKSAWVCPICSTNKMSKVKGRLEKVKEEANRQELFAIFATYTLQHTLKDKFDHIFGDLYDAWRYTFNGSKRKRFRSKYGLVGYANVTEPRYSLKTGHHPHIHQVMFFKQKPDLAEIENELYKQYGAYLEERGYLVNDHTIDVRFARLDSDEGKKQIDDYLTKSAIEIELTANDIKSGKSLSPFQLLTLFDETGELQLAEAFKDYAEGTKRRKRVTGLGELEKALGIFNEEEENEGDGEETADYKYLALLTRKMWTEVDRLGLRGQLKIIAGSGDVARIKLWLVLKGVIAESEDITGNGMVDILNAQAHYVPESTKDSLMKTHSPPNRQRSYQEMK